MTCEATARQRLLALKADLEALSQSAAGDCKPVALDPQSVGRLSRQDSLQVQAMAHAADARRAGELRRIAAALVRLEAGEYGWCVECGEEIGDRRPAPGRRPGGRAVQGLRVIASISLSVPLCDGYAANI